MHFNQKNFAFVDIISTLFLAVLCCSNFLGLLYITDGGIAFSAIGSSVIVVFYYYLVDLIKQNKEILYKKKFIHASSVFILFFIAISFISFFLMSHFINIEYNCKDAIVNEANQKLDKVDSLSIIYKTRSNIDIQNLEYQMKTKLIIYKTAPDMVLKNELKSFPYNISESLLNNPNSIDISMVTNSVMAPVILKIEKNTQTIDTNINRNSLKLRRVFNNWKRMSLVSSYSRLNFFVASTKKEVDKMLAELPLNIKPSRIVFNDAKLPLNSPLKLNEKFKPNLGIPITMILLTHFLILAPVFLQKTRSYSSAASNPIVGSLEI